MLPNREGRFRAVIADVGITESGKPPKCCVVFTFNLVSEHTADGWTDCESEGMSIPGYFYIEKSDGSINEYTVNNFKEVLLWDGKKIGHLTTVKGAEVQVSLQWEEYQGKRSIRVKYMNSADAEGGAVKHDPEAVKRAEARLGSKLRALSGGAPVAATKPAQTASTPAPSTPPQVSAPATADGGFPWESSSADACWSEFEKKFSTLPQAVKGKGWNDLIQRTHPGCTDINTLSPEQWGEVWAEMNKPDFRVAV